eukprot:1882240-Amphidinium_carterae.2
MLTLSSTATCSRLYVVGAALDSKLGCDQDMRQKFTQQGSDVQGDEEVSGEVDRSQGATRAISSYIDPVRLLLEDTHTHTHTHTRRHTKNRHRAAESLGLEVQVFGLGSGQLHSSY